MAAAIGDTSGPVIPQLASANGHPDVALATSPSPGPAGARKRAPLRLRPVDRADMSWPEHSGASRELASILTFELTLLEELVPGDAGHHEAGTDSPAGAAPVHPLHSSTAVS